MAALSGALCLVLLWLFVSPLPDGACGSEAVGTAETPGGAGPGERFKIEGRAVVPGVKPQDWIAGARVLVDGEEHVGFLKTCEKLFHCTSESHFKGYDYSFTQDHANVFGSLKIELNFDSGDCQYIKTTDITLQNLQNLVSVAPDKPVQPSCGSLTSYLGADLINTWTDGSFVVHDVPSGSYVVEVISPAHKFEPVRVDITSKGKMRARYVNYIKTSEVVRLPYPLQMKSSGPPSYFIKRESWGWTDFLMNPMVMMMVLPLLIFVLLPKVVNTSDPDMRREMEQSMNMLNSNHELPDVSEFMTRLFSSKPSSKSGSSSSKAGKSSSGKRR